MEHVMITKDGGIINFVEPNRESIIELAKRECNQRHKEVVVYKRIGSAKPIKSEWVEG